MREHFGDVLDALREADHATVHLSSSRRFISVSAGAIPDWRRDLREGSALQLAAAGQVAMKT